MFLTFGEWPNCFPKWLHSLPSILVFWICLLSTVGTASVSYILVFWNCIQKFILHGCLLSVITLLLLSCVFWAPFIWCVEVTLSCHLYLRLILKFCFFTPGSTFHRSIIAGTIFWALTLNSHLNCPASYRILSWKSSNFRILRLFDLLSLISKYCLKFIASLNSVWAVFFCKFTESSLHPPCP